MSETNKQLALKIFEEVLNQGDLAVIDEIYAEDFVAHIANTPEATNGIEAFKQFVVLFQALHPELRFTVEDQIAEGDRVATRWTARAPDMGNEAAITGITIHRLADGKVVESWDNWDAAGALQARGPELFDQIGLSL